MLDLKFQNVDGEYQICFSDEEFFKVKEEDLNKMMSIVYYKDGKTVSLHDTKEELSEHIDKIYEEDYEKQEIKHAVSFNLSANDFEEVEN
ncbi:hypothetical protein NSQ26_05945 [Bacillus sp. FSL W7-1360]